LPVLNRIIMANPIHIPSANKKPVVKKGAAPGQAAPASNKSQPINKKRALPDKGKGSCNKCMGCSGFSAASARDPHGNCYCTHKYSDHA
jgi:hypothetical protein